LQLRIRTARPEDYPALTELHNLQNTGHHHTSAERLLARDAWSTTHDAAFQRVVAESGGKPIGSGTLSH
jgi:hypothetical protein